MGDSKKRMPLPSEEDFPFVESDLDFDLKIEVTESEINNIERRERWAI